MSREQELQGEVEELRSSLSALKAEHHLACNMANAYSKEIEQLTSDVTAFRDRAIVTERERNDADWRASQAVERLRDYREVANENAAKLEVLSVEHTKLRKALKQLRIDANRLCDRNLGGTYEEDCRRSIAVAEAALASPDPTEPR